MDDKAIGALLKSSPEMGIQAMMKEYYGLVKAITTRILYFSDSDSEECLADTFIQIWKNADRIDFEKGTFKEYIVCTARNLSIDRYRKITRTTAAELYENVLYEKKDILDDLISKESIESVKRIVAGLKEPRKEITIRRYFLFETVKEISIRLDLPTKKVENHLYQAKLFIRKQLEERVR